VLSGTLYIAVVDCVNKAHIGTVVKINDMFFLRSIFDLADRFRLEFKYLLSKMKIKRFNFCKSSGFLVSD